MGGYPDSKVNGTNMGPIWGRQDPGRPHVVPVNFVIWVHCSTWDLTKNAVEVRACMSNSITLLYTLE